MEKKRFALLAPLIAREQVKGFDLSTEDQKKLFEENLNHEIPGEPNYIKSASNFVQATILTQHDLYEYLWKG